MLFRSLPRIEPSSDFPEKLKRRLLEVKSADAAAAAHGNSTLRLGAALTLTSAVMLVYIGFSLRRVDTPQDIALPPVVAVATVADTSGPTPEMIAATPAGLPIWTAALYAEQTPAHFASLEVVPEIR